MDDAHLTIWTIGQSNILWSNLSPIYRFWRHSHPDAPSPPCPDASRPRPHPDALHLDALPPAYSSNYQNLQTATYYPKKGKKSQKMISNS